MLCRKLRLLKKIGPAAPGKGLSLPTRIGMAQWERWRWIKTGTSLRQLQRAARLISDRDAVATRRSLARELTQTTPRAPSLRQATANILSAQQLHATSRH